MFFCKKLFKIFELFEYPVDVNQKFKIGYALVLNVNKPPVVVVENLYSKNTVSQGNVVLGQVTVEMKFFILLNLHFNSQIIHNSNKNFNGSSYGMVRDKPKVTFICFSLSELKYVLITAHQALVFQKFRIIDDFCQKCNFVFNILFLVKLALLTLKKHYFVVHYEISILLPIFVLECLLYLLDCTAAFKNVVIFEHFLNDIFIYFFFLEAGITHIIWEKIDRET